MMNLPKALRYAAVGPLSFGGWLLANLLLLLVFPALLIVERAGKKRARHFLKRLSRGFLRFFFLRYLTIIRLHRVDELPDADTIEKLGPCLIAANHRSWLDALWALALIPDAVLPVSARYAGVPLVGAAMRWLGCVPIERKSPAQVAASLETVRAALREGRGPVVVFPEGTRARFGRLRLFQDLFFRVAIDEKVPVVPMILHSDVPYLSPDEGSLLTKRRAVWTIRLLEPVSVDRTMKASDLSRCVRKKIAVELERLDDDVRERGKK